MDLFQLETFLAVAEERSFSRAATRLHRTQPAVSQAIAKLEGELGEVLFERSSRDGTLTDAGEVLREYAAKLLNLRGEAEGALTELRELHRGKLRLAANEYTCLYLLPVLDEYRRAHARIKVAVRRGLASRISDDVLSHAVEIGVLSFKPEDAQVQSVVVYRDQLQFVVAPGHRMAGRELSALTLRLLRDPASRDAAHGRSAQLSARFGWEQTADSYCKVFTELRQLGGRAG